MRLKMVRTLPKCSGTSSFVGTTSSESLERWRGTALLLQQEQGGRRNHPNVWRAETTAWQVGMGGISCFKGGTAWPVGDRQDGFADKQPGIVWRTCCDGSGLVWTLILFGLSSSLQFSFLHFAILKLFFSGPLYGFAYKVQKVLKETVLRIDQYFSLPTYPLARGLV